MQIPAEIDGSSNERGRYAPFACRPASRTIEQVGAPHIRSLTVGLPTVPPPLGILLLVALHECPGGSGSALLSSVTRVSALHMSSMSGLKGLGPTLNRLPC